MVTVKIEEQLPIDDVAAELLNAITSRRFVNDVYLALPNHLIRRYKPEEITKVLNSVHCATAGVLRQRNAALRAIENAHRASAPDVERANA